MMKRMIPLNLLLGLSILATGNAAAQTEALQEYSLPGMNVTARLQAERLMVFLSPIMLPNIKILV